MPTKPKLHLDADTSSKTLMRVLTERGHDVTRTPNEWMAENAADDVQVQEATLQGRIIFTHNIKDFMPLAYTVNHAGLLVAKQQIWTLSSLIRAIDRMLTETTAEEWIDQVRWLNQWR